MSQPYQRAALEAPLGLLGLEREGLPMVGPAAFFYAADDLWLTTSRFAAKAAVARQSPGAAFLIPTRPASLLLRGRIEVFDPASASSISRAALLAPRVLAGLTGYALKNVPFAAGYLGDLRLVPRRWWLHNRLLLRLKVTSTSLLETPEASVARASAPPWLAQDVGRGVSRLGVAQLCFRSAGRLQFQPVLWAPEERGAALWSRHRLRATGAVLVLESAATTRPSRVLGAAVGGRLVPDAAAGAELQARYGRLPEGATARLVVERVTSWRGFSVRSDYRAGAPAGGSSR